MNQHLPVSTTRELMLGRWRWLIYKSIPRPGKKPAKIPYYANGQPRSGKLDTSEDVAQFASYDKALAALQKSPGVYAGLAFALGRDASGSFWQGIDFDDIIAKGLGSIANEWSVGAYSDCCYVELSPSGNGMHVIGLGRAFPFNLDDNGTGIEAYSAKRFFTFTDKELLPQGGVKRGQPIDLYDYVGQVLYPRWNVKSKTAHNSYAGEALVTVSPTTIAALRSAIHFWDPNDRDEWIDTGHALKPLGLPGWDIWDTWSQHSLTKYDPKDAKRVWDSFKPDGRTNYQAIFKIAQKREWVNPDGKESLRVRFCSSCGATVALPPLSTDGQGVRNG
jgi:hypothetical protein